MGGKKYMDIDKNKVINNVLENISPNDALGILKVIIDRHKELKDEICKIATELLSNVNSAEIASDVDNELN